MVIHIKCSSMWSWGLQSDGSAGNLPIVHVKTARMSLECQSLWNPATPGNSHTMMELWALNVRACGILPRQGTLTQWWSCKPWMSEPVESCHTRELSHNDGVVSLECQSLWKPATPGNSHTMMELWALNVRACGSLPRQGTLTQWWSCEPWMSEPVEACHTRELSHNDGVVSLECQSLWKPATPGNCHTMMELEHRLAALLQLHLHSQLEHLTSMDWTKQLQDETRIFQVLEFGAPYNRDLTVRLMNASKEKYVDVISNHSNKGKSHQKQNLGNIVNRNSLPLGD